MHANYRSSEYGLFLIRAGLRALSLLSRRRSSALRPSPSALSLPSSVICLFAVPSFLPGSALAQDVDTNTPPQTATQPSSVPFIGNAYSQPTSASGYSGMAPATPFAGTSQLSVAPPLAPSGLTDQGLARIGFVTLFPHINYNVSYGNNLQGSPGQQSDSVVNEVSPGMLLKLGRHWSLDYTPTLRFYSSRQLQDGVDHVVNLTGQTTYEDWSLALSQGYAATSQPLIETASQLSQEVYSTSLRAGHPMGSKLSLDLGLNQNFRYVDQGQQLGFTPVSDSLEWSTMDWINYKFAPALSTGIGAGFTYDDVSIGPNMTSEQFQGRINWAASDKITFSVSGGLEDRQFLSADVPDLISPIFSASAQYHLFSHTLLGLSASRSVAPSYFPGSLTEATTVTASLRQRLLERLFLNVSGGYNSSSYQQTSSTIAAATGNNYDATSLNISLSTVFLRRASASLFFQENFVSSGGVGPSSSLYNYATRQYGLSLGYHW